MSTLFDVLFALEDKNLDLILTTKNDNIILNYDEREHIITRDMLNCRNDQGYTIFDYACLFGKYETCKNLLKYGVDIVQTHTIYYYHHHHHHNNIEFQLHETPLILAVKSCCYELVEYLLNYCDVNGVDTLGNTPLIIISDEDEHEQYNTISIIHLLLCRGANIHHKNRSGINALINASKQGNFEVVKLLVSQGANLNDDEDDKNSPLHCAVSRGHIHIVEYLLNQGANIDKQNIVGISPLIKAVMLSNCWMICDEDEEDEEDNYKYAMIRLLISKNTNPFLTDNEGKTALDYAMTKDDEYLISMLQSYIQSFSQKTQIKGLSLDEVELENLCKKMEI